MTNWLHQNLPLVVGWLVTFLSSVVTSVVLAPIVSHRLRRSAESRDAHLAELKQKVLGPMLEYLRDHVIPILELKRGNLGIRGWFVRRPAGVLESPSVYTQDFCVREATEPPIDAYRDFHEDTLAPPPLDGALLEDASAHHFQALIAKWKGLMSSFDKYNAACVSYAERLKSEIARASPLPKYDPALSGPPLVHTAPLALIVFYRQLELDTGQFSRAAAGENVEALAYQASHWFAQGPPDEITKISTRLDDLIAQRETVERLIADANCVREDALKVRGEIDRLLLMRRLSGKCQYLA